MAKKKKNASQAKKQFGNNPFSDLRGFAVSAPIDERTAKSTPRQVPPEKGAIGSFAEEMELLGVQRLTPADKEGVESPPESRPPAQAEGKPSAAPNDEQLFMQAVGEMQVRFGEHLSADEEPVNASPRRMKQLRQGKLSPDASLDLHGLQRAEVANKIGFFLQDAVYHGWRTVLVITGKGLHSEDGTAVLRAEAERFLNSEGRKWVAEWGRAPRQYGGTGALILFLRKS